MTVLWTSPEAVAATGGKCGTDWQATGVSIDTRTLNAGDLFVALQDTRDGHDFVAQALAKGAAAALVARVPDGISPKAPLLIVPDVLAALGDLGRAARERTKARVIAVTGSVGKTSTKDMLSTLLAGQGRVHAAVNSLNNHWGVPLTLARMPHDADFAVIEIGMNHAGEISALTRLVRPEVALITTIAEAHMAAFRSIDDIAHAKAEIFDGLLPGGHAILNCDNPSFGILQTAARAKSARITTFGGDSQADYRLLGTKSQQGLTLVEAEIDGDLTLFKIGAPGRHLAMNALAVLAALDVVGADMVVGALDLATWQPPQGRGQRYRIALDPIEDDQCLELIDDAYNANPASMSAAFEVLADSHPVDGIGRVRKGRRLAFLSDMLELGADEVEKHRALAGLPWVEKIDLVHAVGPLMKHFYQALPYEKQGEWHFSAEKLAARVHHLLDAGDVVMVKGSKGSHASLVVDAIQKLGQANTR